MAFTFIATLTFKVNRLLKKVGLFLLLTEGISFSLRLYVIFSFKDVRVS